MVSLIVPYFLTFLGLMVDSAHDFPAFAVVFTAAGVLWTAGRGLAKESGGKAIALMVAGHGVIWLLFKFKPEMLGAAIGIAIGLAFAVPVALIGWSVVIRPLFFGLEGVWLSIPIADFTGCLVASLFLFFALRAEDNDCMPGDPACKPPSSFFIPRKY